MAHFKISPEAIIEKARFLFLSESFIQAFNLINDSFEMEEQDVISLLKGELDLVDIDLVEGSDLEYIKECKDILSNHDFLFKLDNKIIQITNKIPFDISAQKNDICTELKKVENTLLTTKSGFFFSLLEKMLQKNNYLSPDAIIYSNNFIYILTTYEDNIYDNISNFYNNPLDAIEKFNIFKN